MPSIKGGTTSILPVDDDNGDDEIGKSTENETRQQQVSSKRWVAFFVLGSLALITTSVVLIIISLENPHSQLPHKIDAVVFHDAKSSGIRSQRYRTQLKALAKNMSWLNHVYVVTSTPDTLELPDDPKFTVVRCNQSVDQAFVRMHRISGIAEYAIFFTDQTFVYSACPKSYWFYNGSPRIFNQPERIASGVYRTYAEANLKPTFVGPLRYWLAAEPSTTSDPIQTDIMIQLFTESNATSREELNCSMFLNSHIMDNVDSQLADLAKSSALFVTFHVSGDDTDTINQKIETMLAARFP